jgi:predicted DNA-binding transcriptional regulator AlpA
MSSNTSNSRFISGAQVRARYGGMSRIWLDRRVKKDPTFPRPITFGNSRRYWSLAETEAYERAAVARAAGKNH